jgi:nucleoside 2-deoxyribosyltransferase
MAMRIYLAGSITDVPLKQAIEWRRRAAQQLQDAGFVVISPLRTGVADLVDERAVFMRDKIDCTRSDIMLLNLIGADHITIGSVCELSWAYLTGLFCVVVMGQGNPHRHAFIEQQASIILEDIDEAVDYIIATFGGL